MGAENLPLPVFDIRAVQRIVSRYMDYATPAHKSGCFGVSFSLPLLAAAPIILGRPRLRPSHCETELSWICKGRVLWKIFNEEH
jgi:hypothetical protein